MTRPNDEIDCDVLIFGGGGAGLWLADRLRRGGHRVLLAEADRLGRGQTVCSQGIIHGGLKYTLGGLLNESAAAIRDMPERWRRCLAGDDEPRLIETTVLSQRCYLWRTKSLSSKVALVGARAGLRAVSERVPAGDVPPPLRGCPGEVFRVPEQVIDPAALLANLAKRNAGHLLRIDGESVNIVAPRSGVVETVELASPDGERRACVRPRWIVFTAGAGNEALRRAAGLPADTMQRRPLHMVMLRGDLPPLFGHCVDRAKTRVTITANCDRDGRTVWQIGGQLAEDGVNMSEPRLIAHARRELHETLPGLDLTGAECAAYRIDRAEFKTPGLIRPAGPSVCVEGNVITAWPTKLALVPQLANLIAERIGPPGDRPPAATTELTDWPRPEPTPPPWQTTNQWTRLD